VDSADQGTLHLVLKGEEISPETVGVKDLSKLLTAFSGMLEAAGGDADEVALVDVRPGSVGYEFNTKPEISLLMADVIAGMGADGMRSVGSDLDAAIRKTRRAIPDNAELVIEQVYGSRRETARLEPGGDKEQPRTIRGQTVKYGLVTGVVAGKRPTARVRVVGEDRVVFMKCSVDDARVFGGLILRNVRVEGVASWDVDSMELQGFEVTAVRKFNPAPLSESLRGLAEIVGGAWSGKDVVAEIARLRGDDE